MHALTQTQTAATISTVDVETWNNPPYPAPACKSPSQVKPIRDRSFSANPPQVQTQALYERSEYNSAHVQRAVSTAVDVFHPMLQKQVPQPRGFLKVQQRSSVKGSKGPYMQTGIFCSLCHLDSTVVLESLRLL